MVGFFIARRSVGMTSRQPQIIRKEMCYAGNDDAQLYMYAGRSSAKRNGESRCGIEFCVRASASVVPFRPRMILSSLPQAAAETEGRSDQTKRISSQVLRFAVRMPSAERKGVT